MHCTEGWVISGITVKGLNFNLACYKPRYLNDYCTLVPFMRILLNNIIQILNKLRYFWIISEFIEIIIKFNDSHFLKKRLFTTWIEFNINSLLSNYNLIQYDFDNRLKIKIHIWRVLWKRNEGRPRIPR